MLVGVRLGVCRSVRLWCGWDPVQTWPRRQAACFLTSGCLSAGGRQRAAVSFAMAMLSLCCQEAGPPDRQWDECGEGDSGRDGDPRRSGWVVGGREPRGGPGAWQGGCMERTFRLGGLCLSAWRRHPDPWARSEPLPLAGEQALWRNSCVLEAGRGCLRPLSHQSQGGPIFFMSKCHRPLPPPNSSLTLWRPK